MNTLLTNNQVRGLLAGGCVIITTNDDVHRHQKIINKGMIKMSTLPEKERDLWRTDMHSLVDPDDNYIVREGEKDTKRIFHYRSRSRGELLEHGIVFNKWQEEMLNSMEYLEDLGYQISQKAWLAITNFIEHNHNIKINDRIDKLISTMRSIHYFPHKEFYAKPHIDLSNITIAFPDMRKCGEFFPALMMRDSREPIKHTQGKAILFLGGKASMVSIPGKKINDIVSGAELKNSCVRPALHFAKRTPKLNEPRFTQIYFGHSASKFNVDELAKIINEEYYPLYAQQVKYDPQP